MRELEWLRSVLHGRFIFILYILQVSLKSVHRVLMTLDVRDENHGHEILNTLQDLYPDNHSITIDKH